MTSNIDKSILEYFEKKAENLSKQFANLSDISSNRYGIITGSLHAILGYQQHFASGDGEKALETVNEACAWLWWSDAIPKEKWLNYSEAREFPFTFRDLWKKYKASRTTETFMTWLAAQ